MFQGVSPENSSGNQLAPCFPKCSPSFHLQRLCFKEVLPGLKLIKVFFHRRHFSRCAPESTSTSVPTPWAPPSWKTSFVFTKCCFILKVFLVLGTPSLKENLQGSPEPHDSHDLYICKVLCLQIFANSASPC